MRSVVILSFLVLAVVGCSGTKSADTAATTETVAVPAAAPQLIHELTDQTKIYVCPTCHMEFDGAGKCTMCNVDLVETKVEYICPADNRPVEHAGKCPRCEVDAKIVKTAMAPSAEAAPSGH